MTERTQRLPLRERVRKAPSRIHGFGLFARIGFSPGDYIGTYNGPETDKDSTYVLWVYDEEGENPIGRDGRNLLRWLNHQEDGNAEFYGFDLHAKKHINPGDEITFDYSGEEAGGEELNTGETAVAPGR